MSDASIGGASPASGPSQTPQPPNASREQAFGRIVLAYLGATVVAVAATLFHRSGHALEVVLWADVVATVWIFGWSVAFRNSSFYDAYWSVAPIAIGAFFLARAEPSASAWRQLLVYSAVLAWGVRLTWNWARGWHGLGHEDWRYVDLQEKTGAAYWLVSFAGIHLFPTVVVYLGSFSMYVGLVAGGRPFGLLDLLATVVTFGSITIEWRADEELRAYRAGTPAPDAILATGLWSRSRHPNYLGEIGFWWGLWLFAVAAQPSAWWWTLVGPAVITAMFRFISLPMIEERMQARRPGWPEHAARVPMLLPRIG